MGIMKSQFRQPFDRKTYLETVRWATLASIKALAPYVNQPTDQIPKSIKLDHQLNPNPSFSHFWTDPVKEGGPLNLKQKNQGKINAFFMAIQKWGPSAGLAALELDVTYKMSIV